MYKKPAYSELYENLSNVVSQVASPTKFEIVKVLEPSGGLAAKEIAEKVKRSRNINVSRNYKNIWQATDELHRNGILYYNKNGSYSKTKLSSKIYSKLKDYRDYLENLFKLARSSVEVYLHILIEGPEAYSGRFDLTQLWRVKKKMQDSGLISDYGLTKSGEAFSESMKSLQKFLSSKKVETNYALNKRDKSGIKLKPETARRRKSPVVKKRMLSSFAHIPKVYAKYLNDKK